MKIKFAHLADYASVSQAGTLSIIGIFTTIFTPRVPMLHPKMVVALAIELDDSDQHQTIDLNVRVVDPENRTMKEAGIKFEVKTVSPLQKELNILIPFDLVTITSYGQHEVQIIHGKKTAKRLSFSVEQLVIPDEQ